MNIFAYFFTGLLFGSFYALCIYRIPRGESIVAHPSHCENCQARLQPQDLVPFFSWLALRGKCRYCGTAISWKHPAVELLSAGLFTAAFVVMEDTKYLLPALALLSVLILVSLIDIEHYLIPNRIIVAGAIVALILNIIFHFITWEEMLLGMLTGGGILYLLALLSKGGLGGGDIKLAALVGTYLGWQKVVLALFLGSFLAAVVGSILILSGRKSSKDPLPFGPFLSMGSLLSMFYGQEIILRYLNFMQLSKYF